MFMMIIFVYPWNEGSNGSCDKLLVVAAYSYISCSYKAFIAVVSGQ